MSAVVDALQEFGIRDIKMPATPLTVWQAIQDAKEGHIAEPPQTQTVIKIV